MAWQATSKKDIAAAEKMARGAKQPQEATQEAPRRTKRKPRAKSHNEPHDGHSIIVREGLLHYEYREGVGHRFYRGDHSTDWYPTLSLAALATRPAQETSE